MKTNCITLQCRFELYWGRKIPNQEMLDRNYVSLYGETPERNDIHKADDHRGTIVYDGENWRELDLGKMEKEAREHFDRPSTAGSF